MKILILGGAGFIGSHLARSFIKKGNQVFVIDNLITGNKKNIKDLLESKDFTFLERDIISFDYQGLPSFDLVYDLASPASPADFLKLSFEIFKVNSIGLINTLEFFVKSKSHTFIFASTSEVYGDPQVSPQSETYFGNVHTTGVRAPYDEGKRFAEAVISAYGRKFNIDYRIARIFNTYGPFMNKEDGRFISNFINQAINGKDITVYGKGEQTRSCCFVSDMVSGLELLGTVKNINGAIVNIGNPDERTVIEMAQLIKSMTKSNSKIIYQPIGQDDPKKRCPDITLAKKVLGWSPRISLEDGLKLTIDYFKNI